MNRAPRLTAIALCLVTGLALGNAINRAIGEGAPSAGGFTGNPFTQNGQHAIVGGDAPTLSSGCGTGATITGTDAAGRVVSGTSSSQPCTVTFAASYGKRPACVVTGISALASYTVAANGASFAITSVVDSMAYHYHCVGYP